MFDLCINRDISVWLSLAFIVGGLVALSWSADRFVEAAARLARAFGVSPLIVGMVIIGFGTSAPELAVSVLAALSDQSNLSLGNAYGSCTFNLGIILGVTAFISPIVVKPSVSFCGVPLLLGVTALSYFLVRDMAFERVNGVSVNRKVAPRRAGDVVAVWADTSLANRELGWRAERSLDDTLRSAWAWEKHVRGME